MNILLTNYTEIKSPGGIHKTIDEIAKNLSKRGHDVTLLQGNPSNLKDEEIYNGYKVKRVKSILGNHFFGLSPEMYFYLKKNLYNLNFDVIHVHGYHKIFSPEIIYYIKKISPETPIAFSPHLDTYRSSFVGKYFWNIYNIFGKNAFKNSSHIVSCSNFEAENIMTNFNVNNGGITIINHGVDDFRPQNGKNNKNNKKGINLLYAGHLVDRKGVNFILESLYSLVHDFGVNNVSLTVVGDGPEKNKLLKLAERLEIEDYITWKPFLPRTDLIDEIRNTDIFMLLSNSEAYGIIIAESLVLGTPCIVANSTALTEFTDENGCFGVDYPLDPEDVANKILEIDDSNIEVGPLSKKIRTWGETVKDYEKLYNDLL